VAPVGTGADWKPNDKYAKNSFPGIILTEDSDYIDNVYHSSYVVGFASTDFISSQWVAYSSINNMDVAINTAKLVSGAEDTGISFTMKQITNESFADKADNTSANVIRVIFQYGMPIILIAAGIYISIRRSRR
jgi:hypothetical protein